MNRWMKALAAGIASGMALAALGAEPAAVPQPAPQKPTSADTMEPAVSTLEPAVTTSPQPAAVEAPRTQPAPAATQPAARSTRGVQDRLELDATQITGNRELPRVMYVVPWKRADLGDLTGRPVNSLLDEVLSPVDRSVFQRQNRYYDALRPDASAPRPEGEK
jgi:hypothetical protein